LDSPLFSKNFRDKELGDEGKKLKIRHWNSLREKTYQSYLEKAEKFKGVIGSHPIIIPV
jgi:hypothetical protein